ncbi:unnamed protein product [Ceutorhynchus assimilis]|uniref:Uncharacterized protein n=1 Tax=Ceutorhynchus assimilis TaxID=467358 RepID=A0A9N9MS52_9CUCU|nr:unnamed protein product [Ceutorhynchus assimilis]
MNIQNKGKTNCGGRDMEAIRNCRDVSLTVDVDEASGATSLNGTTRMATNKDNKICRKSNQKISFTRENIFGDGLFRAASLHIYGHQDSHGQLRQDAVKYILETAGDFEILKPVIAKNDNDVETVDSLSKHELAEDNGEVAAKSETSLCVTWIENALKRASTKGESTDKMGSGN